ncbi:MAG: M20/M25/M40 family metallo-hydrolase, partial [Longimicrobiales bacterium]
GVSRPIALVKVAEKASLTLELLVRGTGGHSAAPPRPTPVGTLARAIARLEDHPFPARLDGATRALMVITASEQPLLPRLVLRNLWLFAPLVKLQMARAPGTDATMRTTIAPTVLQASPKDNVLPTVARALVNFRVMPGQSHDEVIAHVRSAIEDSRVEIRTIFASDPMPAADPEAPEFAMVRDAIRQVAPDVLVAPFLLTAATDSRYFAGLTTNIYGFSTARAGPEALERAHGTNERIRIADLVTGVRFYAQIIRNTQKS